MQPVIVTRCGYFDFRSPDEYEFEIDVIGRALSKLCRFTGHTMQFYSVAQHSVFVSMLLEAEGPELAMMGLLHDAAEAFVGDVAAPLKMLLPEYKMIEQRVERAICRAFGLPEVMPELVKDAGYATVRRSSLRAIQKMAYETHQFHIGSMIEDLLR